MVNILLGFHFDLFIVDLSIPLYSFFSGSRSYPILTYLSLSISAIFSVQVKCKNVTSFYIPLLSLFKNIIV